MPLYEYRCEKCSQVFSLLQKMSEEQAEVSCPMCGAASKRVISACSISSGNAPTCEPSGGG